MLTFKFLEEFKKMQYSCFCLEFESYTLPWDFGKGVAW